MYFSFSRKEFQNKRETKHCFLYNLTSGFPHSNNCASIMTLFSNIIIPKNKNLISQEELDLNLEAMTIPTTRSPYATDRYRRAYHSLVSCVIIFMLYIIISSSSSSFLSLSLFSFYLMLIFLYLSLLQWMVHNIFTTLNSFALVRLQR